MCPMLIKGIFTQTDTQGMDFSFPHRLKWEEKWDTN